MDKFARGKMWYVAQPSGGFNKEDVVQAVGTADLTERVQRVLAVKMVWKDGDFMPDYRCLGMVWQGALAEMTDDLVPDLVFGRYEDAPIRHGRLDMVDVKDGLVGAFRDVSTPSDEFDDVMGRLLLVPSALMSYPGQEVISKEQFCLALSHVYDNATRNDGLLVARVFTDLRDSDRSMMLDVHDLDVVRGRHRILPQTIQMIGVADGRRADEVWFDGVDIARDVQKAVMEMLYFHKSKESIARARWGWDASGERENS